MSRFRAEYQYKSWEGREGDEWWVECDITFKTKKGLDGFLKEMSDNFTNIAFREKKSDQNAKVKEEPKPVIIYTDGSSNYRDGTGGIGIYLKYGEHEKMISKGYINTTNNRMEMRAAIESLRMIKNKNFKVWINSDSEYVVNIANHLGEQWEGFGFSGKKNVDLVKQLLIEHRKFPKGNVKFNWCRGHNGNEGNEIADLLASEGRLSSGDKIKCQ